MATEEEGQESGSSSEEEEQKDPGKNPASVIVTAEKQNSDSDSGSESESESDSESELASTKEKEVCGSGDAQPTKNTKQTSEVVAASTDVAKKDDKMVAIDTKKEYFQRKWSEDDEIVLLQGMIDFKNDKGKSAYDDMTGFFETLKNYISFQVKNQRQFTTKIRCLKDKYVRKRSKGADEKSFANAHDRKCFKLSKVIWESTKVEESLKPNEGEKVQRDWFVNSFLVGSIARFGMGEDVVKQRWSMVSMKTKKKLKEKFKLLQDKAFECLSLKTSFLHEVTSVIAEAN